MAKFKSKLRVWLKTMATLVIKNLSGGWQFHENNNVENETSRDLAK